LIELALLQDAQDEQAQSHAAVSQDPTPAKATKRRPGKSVTLTKSQEQEGGGWTGAGEVAARIPVLWRDGPEAAISLRPLPKAYEDQSLVGIQYLRGVVTDSTADPILRQAAAQKLTVIEKASAEKMGDEDQLHRRPRTRIQREIAQLWDKVRAQGIVN
jgi:hypothetical protein